MGSHILGIITCFIYLFLFYLHQSVLSLPFPPPSVSFFSSFSTSISQFFLFLFHLHKSVLSLPFPPLSVSSFSSFSTSISQILPILHRNFSNFLYISLIISKSYFTISSH